MPGSGVDSGGAGGARAPPEFGGPEKRTEREIDSINKSTPEFIYLWLCIVSYRYLKNPKRLSFGSSSITVLFSEPPNSSKKRAQKKLCYFPSYLFSSISSCSCFGRK